MADDEVLRRIDAHMERSNEIFEDHRGFLRELTLRQEKVFSAMIDRLDDQGRAIRELTEQMREQTRQMREHRDEFAEESRAQRAALFRMLDRLDGGADPAGA